MRCPRGTRSRARWLTGLSSRFSDNPSFVTVREHLHLRERAALVAALERRQRPREIDQSFDLVKALRARFPKLREAEARSG